MHGSAAHTTAGQPGRGVHAPLASDDLLRQLSKDDPACSHAIDQLASGSLGGLVIARLRRMTAYDDDRACDLAQETWLRVWKARGTWDAQSGGAAVQFVLSVAENVFRGNARSESRRARRHERVLAGAEVFAADRDVELTIDLSAALYRLEERHRALLLRAYQDGLSDGELALELGITREATKKRRQSALKRLRHVYSKPPGR
jgi:RNA polymerase sigma factor (sigma-70 family)